MKILIFLKSFVLILLLVGGVFLVTHYGEYGKNQILSMIGMGDANVKGASTQKAEELTDKFSEDIGTEVDKAKDHVLDTKVSDVFSGLSRLQKIPQDAISLKDYISEQMNTFLHPQRK